MAFLYASTAEVSKINEKERPQKGTFPSSQRRGVRDIKKMDPFRFVADGVVSSAPLRRPAELTTITASRYRARASRITASRYRARASRITASRYRARASRPSAAFVASRHFLDGAATPPLRGGEYDPI